MQPPYTAERVARRADDDASGGPRDFRWHPLFTQNALAELTEAWDCYERQAGLGHQRKVVRNGASLQPFGSIASERSEFIGSSPRRPTQVQRFQQDTSESWRRLGVRLGGSLLYRTCRPQLAHVASRADFSVDFPLKVGQFLTISRGGAK